MGCNDRKGIGSRAVLTLQFHPIFVKFLRMNSNHRISEDQLVQSRHMTAALLESMTPYQIAKEIGVMYHTVIKIANGQTSWISLKTFGALNNLHQRWRSGRFDPFANQREVDGRNIEVNQTSALFEGSGSAVTKGLINVGNILAELAKLEKRLVILYRLRDLEKQL